jgi:hypothetical protein
MKIDITLNGVKVTKDLPLSWEEVPFRQLLDLAGLEEDVDILSVFTGIDSETLLKAKINNLGVVLSAIQFVRTKIDYGLPKSILGYKIKDNIEIEEIQRYADLESILKAFGDDPKENLKKYPLIVSTYVVEPYNFRDAENMAASFLDAPALEVLAVANFIRVNISVLSIITPKVLHLADLQKTKSKRGMKVFISRLAFSLFWFLWRRRLPNPVRNYLGGQLRNLNLIYGS